MNKRIDVKLVVAAEPPWLFRALASAPELTRWFCEHAEVSLEERRYDFWGRFTPEAPDRDHGRHPLLAVEPDRRLTFGWRLCAAETTVDIRLEPQAENTQVSSSTRECLLTSRAKRRMWRISGLCPWKTCGLGLAEFGFSNRATLFCMRTDEIIPEERVVWTCVGDVEEWKGTHLIWELRRSNDSTELRFTHGNWRATDGWFATCNSTWGALMYRLKDYAEGKAPGPFFTGRS